MDSVKLGMEPQDEFMADGSDSVRGASRGPRLFIREMVMKNFKSYAGEQRVGPFHKVRVCSQKWNCPIFFFFVRLEPRDFVCGREREFDV